MKGFAIAVTAAIVLVFAYGPSLLAQGGDRVSDAESLQQFLFKMGQKDVKIIKLAGQPPCCVYNHDFGGARFPIKAYGFPDEPVVELFVELNVPAGVPSSSLLKVLQKTGGWVVFYRPNDNKLVIQRSIFSKDLGNFRAVMEGNGKTPGLCQQAQEIYSILNPPAEIK